MIMQWLVNREPQFRRLFNETKTEQPNNLLRSMSTSICLKSYWHTLNALYQPKASGTFPDVWITCWTYSASLNVSVSKAVPADEAIVYPPKARIKFSTPLAKVIVSDWGVHVEISVSAWQSNQLKHIGQPKILITSSPAWTSSDTTETSVHVLV